MAGIYQFDTIASYNDFNNHETLHPLVSVIDFGNAKPRSWDGNTSVKINYGFYTIFLKDVKCGDLKYGCNYYDYQEGTLVFVAPGQVLDVETDGKVYQPKGYGLVFHEELIPFAAINIKRVGKSFYIVGVRILDQIQETFPPVTHAIFIDHGIFQGNLFNAFVKIF